MKKTIDILKSENLKPKELALLLLTDIHENQKTGKETLSEKDKAVLMKRVKNFDSREDCFEYNKYGRAYFEGAHVNVDVFTCDREAIRIIECLRWLLALYIENKIVINLIDDEQIRSSSKSLKRSIVKAINGYSQELNKVYGALLAYKKIVDAKTEFVGLDINYLVDKSIRRVTEAVKNHNDHINSFHMENDFHIELAHTTFDEDLYNITKESLSTIEHFKTA